MEKSKIQNNVNLIFIGLLLTIFSGLISFTIPSGGKISFPLGEIICVVLVLVGCVGIYKENRSQYAKNAVIMVSISLACLIIGMFTVLIANTQAIIAVAKEFGSSESMQNNIDFGKLNELLEEITKISSGLILESLFGIVLSIPKCISIFFIGKMLASLYDYDLQNNQLLFDNSKKYTIFSLITNVISIPLVISGINIVKTISFNEETNQIVTTGNFSLLLTLVILCSFAICVFSIIAFVFYIKVLTKVYAVYKNCPSAEDQLNIQNDEQADSEEMDNNPDEKKGNDQEEF